MTRALIRPDILYAWKGSSLLIVTPRGECGEEHPLSGFYYREARFLRTCRFEVNGQSPWLCEAVAAGPHLLQFTYVHPEQISEESSGGPADDEGPRGADGTPQRSLDIRLTYVVGAGGLSALATIVNRSRRTLEFEIAWTLDADFADIQEAQWGSRSRAPRSP